MKSKGLLRVSSSNKVQKHQFSGIHPSLCPSLTSIHDYWKKHNFDFVGKMMSLLFHMLSRAVTAFLSRSTSLLISWLQLASTVILEPRHICSLFLWNHWNNSSACFSLHFLCQLNIFKKFWKIIFTFIYFIELILLFSFFFKFKKEVLLLEFF